MTTMAALGSTEIAGRVRAVKSTFIEHRYSREIFNALDNLLVDGTGPQSAEGLVIHGVYGTGKTSSCLVWMQNHPVRYEDPSVYRPVAFAKIASGTCTHRSVAVDIVCAFEDDPVLSRQETEKTLLRRALSRMRQQRTKVLLVDEAQQLVSSTNHRVNYSAAEWMRQLLDEATCAIVFLGQFGMTSAITSSGSFERRTWGSVELKPYSWLVPADRNEFCAILREFAVVYPWFKNSGFESTERAYQMHKAARDGTLAFLTRLLAKSTRIGLDRGADTITCEHFAAAFDVLCVNKEDTKGNPFR